MKAIIFDRDGVLADFMIREATDFFEPLLPFSVEVLSERWGEWGSAVGFPKSVAEEEIFFSTFWNYICDELALPNRTRQLLLQFDYANYMRAFADAQTALQFAHSNNMKVGVLSNFSLASLEHSLETIGLLKYVDCACAATVIGAAKPEPESYLTVCRQLNVTPENCLFFDDEIACVRGARDIGMSAYHVDRWQKRHHIGQGVVKDLSVVPQILDLH